MGFRCTLYDVQWDYTATDDDGCHCLLDWNWMGQNIFRATHTPSYYHFFFSFIVLPALLAALRYVEWKVG